ncbi:nucleolar complex-associated protein 3, partial [Aureobasidium melanogenum]
MMARASDTLDDILTLKKGECCDDAKQRFTVDVSWCGRCVFVFFSKCLLRSFGRDDKFAEGFENVTEEILVDEMGITSKTFQYSTHQLSACATASFRDFIILHSKSTASREAFPSSSSRNNSTDQDVDEVATEVEVGDSVQESASARDSDTLVKDLTYSCLRTSLDSFCFSSSLETGRIRLTTVRFWDVAWTCNFLSWPMCSSGSSEIKLATRARSSLAWRICSRGEICGTSGSSSSSISSSSSSTSSSSSPLPKKLSASSSVCSTTAGACSIQPSEVLIGSLVSSFFFFRLREEMPLLVVLGGDSTSGLMRRLFAIGAISRCGSVGCYVVRCEWLSKERKKIWACAKPARLPCICGENETPERPPPHFGKHPRILFSASLFPWIFI